MTPARLLGGERNAVIAIGVPSLYVVLNVAPKVPSPMCWVVALIATAVWFGGLAALYKLWTVDPWLLGPGLNGTLFRFMRLPKYMPAKAHACEDRRRTVLRERSHVRR